MSRLVQGLIRLPIHWVLESLSLELTQPVYETGRSRPSSADIKNAWICVSTTPYAFMLCTGTSLSFVCDICLVMVIKISAYPIEWYS